MSYIVTKTIDYLSFTSKYAENPFQEKPYQAIKPVIANYEYAEIHKSGTIHMWSDKNPKVGHHYICSGSTLQWFREHGHDDIKIVSSAMEHGSISRLDIAITSQREDEKIHEFTPSAIAVMCTIGELKSRMKANNGLIKNGLIETQYIGSPKVRKRLFRAYDKGIEQGFLSNLLIRYELETRKGANVIARQVRSGTDLGAIMRRYVDFPSIPVWLDIMNAEPSTVIHETGEIAMDSDEKARFERQKKWYWLNESIAPLIRRMIAENAEYDGVTLYENEFLAEFKKLAGII